MKKIYVIFMIFVITQICYSQPPILNTYSLSNEGDLLYIAKKGSYSKDTMNKRNLYIGTWEYNQGGTIFQIKIEKVDQHLTETNSNYYYLDIVSIKYKLVKNGIEIYNNLNDNEFDSEGVVQGNDNYLNCSFLDAEKNVMVNIIIEKIVNSSNPEKILFKITNGYTLLNPIQTYQSTEPLFSIPTQPIEMIKL